MLKEIILLVDYKKQFGSKFDAVPYRSGMNIEKILHYFRLFEYDIKILPFNEIDFKNNYHQKVILYTSSEDPGLFYKNYIEDVILALEINGAIVIPSFKYLRANNNKVFMEMIRNQSNDSKINSIHSNHFGTLEEFLESTNHLTYQYPLVIKPADGSMSRGVGLAKNLREAERLIKKISRVFNLYDDLWELGRSIKHKGYKQTSKNRKKFIVQNYIDRLKNDWKILIFGDKYYVLKRLNRENDFRASGGGRLQFTKTLPEGLLDFAESIFDILDLPYLSLDIAYDGFSFHLFEFQAIHFGTYTLNYSGFYFKKSGDSWNIIDEKSDLEKTYVESIIRFINEKNF